MSTQRRFLWVSAGRGTDGYRIRFFGAGVTGGRHGQGARRSFFRLRARFLRKSTRPLGQKLSSLMFEGPDTVTDHDRQRPAGSHGRVHGSAADAGGRSWRRSRRGRQFVAVQFARRIFRARAAGSFTLADTARLLRLRGDAMQKAVPVGRRNGCFAVGLDYEAGSRCGRGGAGRRSARSPMTTAAGRSSRPGSKSAVERAV